MPIKHGMYKTRPYSIWTSMLNRCRNPKTINYARYGGKGIKVCERWKLFENFWEDMRDGYADNLQIDRIDNNKGYSKENCRWVTPAEQSRNREIVNLIEYNGKKQSLFDWDKEKGFTKGTVRARIKYYKWSVERAIETPSLSKSAKNISYDKIRNQWKAYKTVGSKRYDLGRFSTQTEALQAVKNFNEKQTNQTSFIKHTITL